MVQGDGRLPPESVWSFTGNESRSDSSGALGAAQTADIYVTIVVYANYHQKEKSSVRQAA